MAQEWPRKLSLIFINSNFLTFISRIYILASEMRKIILLSFYLILIIYSVEILAKFFIPKQNDLINKNMDSLRIAKINKIKNFDVRNDYNAFKEEKEKHDIYPSFRLSMNTLNKNDKTSKFLKDSITKNIKIPFRGPINKLSLGDNEEGKRELISNDKYEFKNFNEVYSKKIDAMIIGDSFAEGVPFDNNNSISGQINENSNFNSINYGVSGTGPLNSLGVLTEYGKFLMPKKVFYLFYEGNDLIDLLEEKETFLINYLDESYSQNLFISKDQIKIFLTQYEDLFFEILPKMLELKPVKQNKDNLDNEFKFLEHLKDILELQNIKRVLIPKDAYYFKNKKIDYKMLENSLTEMKNRTNSWNGEFHLVFLPSWTRYNSLFSLSDNYIKKELIKIAKDNNIPFFDMDYIFKKNNMDNINLFNLGIYGHYTKEGYRLLASTIIKELN